MSPGLVPGVNGAEGDGRGAAARLGHKGQNTRAPRGTDGDRGGNSRGDTGREGAPAQWVPGGRGEPDPCGSPHSPPSPPVPPAPLGVPSCAPLPDPPRLLLSGSIPALFSPVVGMSRRGDPAGRVPPVHPRCPGAGGSPRPGVAAAGLRAAPSRRCGPSERTMSPLLFN